MSKVKNFSIKKSKKYSKIRTNVTGAKKTVGEKESIGRKQRKKKGTSEVLRDMR